MRIKERTQNEWRTCGGQLREEEKEDQKKNGERNEVVMS